MVNLLAIKTAISWRWRISLWSSSVHLLVFIVALARAFILLLLFIQIKCSAVCETLSSRTPTGASRKRIFYHVDTESNSSTGSSERVGSGAATWMRFAIKWLSHILTEHAIHLCRRRLMKSPRERIIRIWKSTTIRKNNC